ncbi:MAG: hypothetical protein ABIQ31_03950 [Ferruginibacter sp.]
MMISQQRLNGVEIFTIENKHLKISLSPTLGGKIISVYNNKLAKEFLWTNQQLALKINPPGSDYDSNFFGGIDELIPNDVPENIDAIDYPDHGELWCTILQAEQLEQSIKVHGTLALSGIHYSKTVSLDEKLPVINCDYTLRNDSSERRHFLWKLHAALNITSGDQLVTSANNGQVIDPDYSRFKTTGEFNWPLIENADASNVPPNNNTMDFFYLYNIPSAEMQMVSGKKEHLFSYRYDKKVFPYQWYFASYGGFLGHYTAILEPCTNMPMNVNAAIAANQCAVLEPGESLTTAVQIFAGEKQLY